MITVSPIPVFKDNYVWVLEQDHHPDVTVVDPGDAAPVVAELKKRRLTIASILLTHHHNDHIGGVQELTRERDIPVYGPSDIASVTNPVDDADTIALPHLDLSLRVLDVPGHTARHAAFLGKDIIFVGDTLFAGGCGRIFEGTPAQMYSSLNVLAGLEPETKIYCAHEYTMSNLQFAINVEPGNGALIERHEETRRLRNRGESTIPSTLKIEFLTNPFLRCKEPEIVESASRWAGRPLDQGLDTFTAIRRWKDSA